MRNGMTEKQGIYVVIGNSGQLPNIVSESLPLYPKSSTELGLTVRNIARLEDPYPSKCADEYPAKYQNMTLNGNFDFLYSEKTCQSMCVNYLINKYCGCYNPKVIEGTLGWRQYANSSFCDTFTEKAPCIDKALTVYRSSSETNNVCECFSECKQAIYTVGLSVITNVLYIYIYIYYLCY